MPRGLDALPGIVNEGASRVDDLEAFLFGEVSFDPPGRNSNEFLRG